MGLGLVQPGEEMSLEGLDCTPPAPTHRLTRRWVQVSYNSMWWTRENRYKFKQKRFRLNVTKNFFTMRTVKQWSRLC